VVLSIIDYPLTFQKNHFIVTTAKMLNKKTIAEQVETQEQLEASQALGVDYIQGYLKQVSLNCYMTRQNQLKIS